MGGLKKVWLERVRGRQWRQLVMTLANDYEMLADFAGAASCATQQEVSAENVIIPLQAAVLGLEVCQSCWVVGRISRRDG